MAQRSDRAGSTGKLTSIFLSSFLFSAHHSRASFTLRSSKLRLMRFICSKVSMSTRSVMPLSSANALALSGYP